MNHDSCTNLPALCDDNKLINLWRHHDPATKSFMEISSATGLANGDYLENNKIEAAVSPIGDSFDCSASTGLAAELNSEKSNCIAVLENSSEKNLDVDLLDNFFDLSDVGGYRVEYRFKAMVAALELSIQQGIREDSCFWSNLVGDAEQIDNSLLFDRLLLDIDKKVSLQLDAILHHPEWQRVESAWRSLDYLLQQAGNNNTVIVEMLDVSLSEWEDHFAENRPEHSHLHRIIYQNAYDMPGAFPYTSIVSGYYFQPHQANLRLLEKMTTVAMSAHCPLLANVSHNFFRKKSMSDVATIQDVSSYLSQADYISWQSFREKECARYAGLALPRFLLRSLYGKDIAVRGFPYREFINPLHPEKHLWAPASFALASNMIRSFVRHGWPVHIRGPRSGGKVLALPLISYGHQEFQIPTEMLIPEARELQLANSGFIPLSYYAGTEYACFFSANAVHKPMLYDSAAATSNSRINARLPYVFLTSRVAHYIKVLQREVIGVQCAAGQLQDQLQRWLQGMVTQMNQPDADLMARYPLRQAKVIVSEKDDNPGFFHVELSLVPHFQVEGMDVQLFLVSKLPGGKG